MGKGSSIFGNVLQTDSKYTYSYTKESGQEKNVESNKLNRKNIYIEINVNLTGPHVHTTN